MNPTNRRKFIKLSALSAAGLGLAGNFPAGYGNVLPAAHTIAGDHETTSPPFVPNRVASWWTTIEDLQWPQQSIVDKIRRRAEGFKKAQIDTAINFGFHIRFDFSSYFGQLHGYYANVCEALHGHGIKFIEHYSCNHISRPKDAAEMIRMNRFQRHHVLLYPDPEAAKYAQYEGHLFNDICQLDLRDGSLGYAPQYQLNAFCHNNPDFLDMHRKYLVRLMKDVPFDGIMVDDMCNYASNTTCGCKYCKARFQQDYGRQIPPFGESSFWGDTKAPVLKWGNYENPVFRDWLQMKSDCIVDHLKMIRQTLAGKPLLTCCSNTGPIVLNALSLDLEKMAPYLDFFVLENVGTNIKNIDWIEMEAEAYLQKDIAWQSGKAPAIALSYTIYEKGAYFGWALSRFWGVSNWSSTLNHRLEVDPPDAMEMEAVIDHSNNWEVRRSNLFYRDGIDHTEVRLVSNRFCRDNGWRDEAGLEHWDRVAAWSQQLVKNNIGYRIVRWEELGDATRLSGDRTPLILDGVGALSDKQFEAIRAYLDHGGTAWLRLPFGTYDEKGFARKQPLSKEVLRTRHKNLTLLDARSSGNPGEQILGTNGFKPVLKQIGGDAGWVVKIRWYGEKPVLHFMNTALEAVAHATLKDLSGVPVLTDIHSTVKDNTLIYEIDSNKINIAGLSIMSPELQDATRPLKIVKSSKGVSTISVNLEGVRIYAVAVGS